MRVVLVVLVLFATMNASAQDIGLQLGIHSTKGSADNSTASAELGYKLGVIGLIDLTESMYFRTGLLYTTRNFTLKNTVEADLEFSYLDIPVLFQMPLNSIVSVYAGGVVAINMDKTVKIPSLNSSGDANDAKSLYLLAQFGGHFMFDGIGFDVYFERGLGEFIGDNGGTQTAAKDYTTIGANFIYLF